MSSWFLSRVDIIDQDTDPPILKVTVTGLIEGLGFQGEHDAHEILYGFMHESVTDRAEYLQYMIEMLVRTLQAQHNLSDVDGMILTEAELANLINRYEQKDQQ